MSISRDLMRNLLVAASQAVPFPWYWSVQAIDRNADGGIDVGDLEYRDGNKGTLALTITSNRHGQPTISAITPEVAMVLANAPQWAMDLLVEIEQLRAELTQLHEEREAKLKEIRDDGMRVGGEPALYFMEMLVGLFYQNGGKNFITMTVERPDKSERFEITVRNLNGTQSLAEKMNEQERTIQAQAAEIERLQAEAETTDLLLLQLNESLTAKEDEVLELRARIAELEDAKGDYFDREPGEGGSA